MNFYIYTDINTDTRNVMERKGDCIVRVNKEENLKVQNKGKTIAEIVYASNLDSFVFMTNDYKETQYINARECDRLIKWHGYEITVSRSFSKLNFKIRLH